VKLISIGIKSIKLGHTADKPIQVPQINIDSQILQIHKNKTELSHFLNIYFIISHICHIDCRGPCRLPAAFYIFDIA